MKRWQIASVVVAASLASAAVGYWLGFAQALPLATAADFVPRGAAAVQQLEALHAGKTRTVATALEFDVDRGLIWGYEVLNHPMRGLWQPLWGWSAYSDTERYAPRLAGYRREHPSAVMFGMFQSATPGRPDLAEEYKWFTLAARDTRDKLNWMIERYAAGR